MKSMIAFAIVWGACCTGWGAEPAVSSRWEADIARFEQQDKNRPPKPGGVVFVGSSTIRLWDLQKYFPELDGLNRGFGGSQVADSAYFANRIVLPYKPRLVVLYAGGNDMNAGRTPVEVADDFKSFVKAIHARLPRTKIVFIAQKPTIARRKQDALVREFNGLVERFAHDTPGVAYVDAYHPFLAAGGEANAELLSPDGLHLNNKGYRLLSAVVAPYLED